ncbi:MAG: sulfotransferase [bacterium]|nr:sulfotransferase [bacterium]
MSIAPHIFIYLKNKVKHHLRNKYSYVFLSDLFYSVAGHADYGKFIIVGSARSGSNLITSYLNSHPQICCYYEIFHPEEFDASRTHHYYPTNRRVHTLFVTHPERFLEEKFFSRHYSKQILWVGFKIFYQHTRQSGQKSVWPYLVENKKLKIIHIKRNNLLAQYLSFIRSQQSGVWSSRVTPNYHQHFPVTLSYENCLKYFKDSGNYIRETERLFYEHDKINVYYEDLLDNKDVQLARIQDFFRLPQQSLRSGLKKQNLQTLSQNIINYEELKRKFAGSKYSHFFTD